MDKKELPIGIQTFRDIREGGCYYVDKTAYAGRLIAEGKHNFLSRPRRFGKSLFLDTLKELFEGNEELFRGLAIHDNWDWSVRHPVLRFSFGGGTFTAPGELHIALMEQLDRVGRRNGLTAEYETASGRFAHLIERLAERSGQQVVVLVDEYDKPILDALDVPDVARANRDYLRGFYGTIKDSDADIRFSFLTGVSKFSRAGLFSGLNNLRDITLDRHYSAICGYTEADLDTVFAPELEGFERERIREWYNGYSWRGAEKVYNPFSILLLFDKREFGSWWFETGTPTFLIDELRKRPAGTLDLGGMSAGDNLLSSFDVGNIKVPALLFQTGYLTIVGEEEVGGRTRYRLDFPNLEVRQSLHWHLLDALAPGVDGEALAAGLREALALGDFDTVREILQAFFASIPHQVYDPNDLARYEGHYASVVYAFMMGTGLSMRAEDATNLGRIDLTAEAGARICLFEFKVLRDGVKRGDAMEQLRARGYAEKYRACGLPVHLVGVEFDPERRNVASFEVASA